ncbi:MAG: glycosyltransferase family 1 protein [Thermodesulfobacteriota bacterium]
MRIAVVTDAWHPQVNGVVTTLYRTAATLEEMGHEVLVVTPERFRTVGCPTYPEIRLALAPRRGIHRLFDAFRPQAVHIATEGPLGWTARACCRQRGLGFTTSYHTRFPEYVRLRFPIPLPVSYAVVRRFHTAARRTMVATAPLREELAARGFRNLVLWGRGVDTSLFRPRPKIHLDGPRPIFIYVGRVAVEKGLEAFCRLGLPGSKYIVGDGPAMDDLRARYPAVRFTGYRRGEELAQTMASADVFVFPSRTDTFGLVLLEAMACGVPVAAYPVTGPLQLVKNGENGVLDADLRQAALAALAVDSSRCRAFANTFSWQACTSQFLDNLHDNDPHAQPRTP